MSSSISTFFENIHHQQIKCCSSSQFNILLCALRTSTSTLPTRFLFVLTEGVALKNTDVCALALWFILVTVSLVHLW